MRWEVQLKIPSANWTLEECFSKPRKGRWEGNMAADTTSTSDDPGQCTGVEVTPLEVQGSESNQHSTWLSDKATTHGNNKIWHAFGHALEGTPNIYKLTVLAKKADSLSDSRLAYQVFRCLF